MTRESSYFSAGHTRLAAVTGLVTFLVLTGTGLANAVWTAAVTTTGTVTAGTLSAAITGTGELRTTYLAAGEYTQPQPLTLENGSPVELDYGLTVTSTEGWTLSPADVQIALWERTGTTCPTTVPSTGTTVGTLDQPLALPPLAAGAGAATSTTVLCAATKYTGAIPDASGKSLTATIHLTGTSGTKWTTTVSGPAFTQVIG